LLFNNILVAGSCGEAMTTYMVGQCQHDSRRSAYKSGIRGGLECTHRCCGFRVGDLSSATCATSPTTRRG
jgi:hypothetical protein